MCIELPKLLKKDFPYIGFLFALENEKTNNLYFEKMKNRMKQLVLHKNFYFMIGQKELWSILKTADLIVRTTNTDGVSISVQFSCYHE